MQDFKSLGLSQELLDAVSDLGFKVPSPIQQKAIPYLLEEGGDLVALSQTGTGKTVSFGFPIIQKNSSKGLHPSALIIAPTRELCLQITNELVLYSKYKKVSVTAVYGGTSISDQIRTIKRGTDIVVATPGRLKDLIDRRVLNLESVDYCVLDEADEMLNMGFYEDIRFILSVTSNRKSLWLFSATMPKEALQISREFMTSPFEITIGTKNTGNENIRHEYYVLARDQRYAAIRKIIDTNPDLFSIVFCRTKMEVQKLSLELSNDGYKTGALHGDLSQSQRDVMMQSFRKKSFKILVATDVAARGIDVNEVTHVINYQLPDDIEAYTHRSGRTGRAGNKGISIVFVTRSDRSKIKAIERIIKQQFEEKTLPSESQILDVNIEKYLSSVVHDEIDENLNKHFDIIDYTGFLEMSQEELLRRVLNVHFADAGRKIVEEERRKLRANELKNRKEGGYTVRFFINLGEKDGLDWRTLKDLLREVTGFDKDDISGVEVKPTFAFFNTLKEQQDTVIACFSNYAYGNRKVSIEVSERRPHRGRQNFNQGGFRERRRR